MSATTIPTSPMGQAVRQAIADHNMQPAIDRRHLELLRAAATRLDACEAEETALRGQYVTAVRLLNSAMGLVGRSAVTATEINTLQQQVASFTLRNSTI